MKRYIILMLALMMLMTACSGVEADKPVITDPPAPSETAEPVEMPEPTPVPDIAIAVYLDRIDHPAYKPMLLGILDACEKLGIDDITFIGDKEEYKDDYNDVIEWKRLKEGKTLGVICDSWLYGSEVLDELNKSGVTVASTYYNADPNDHRIYLFDGFDFSVTWDYLAMGEEAAYHLLSVTEGEEGILAEAGMFLNSYYNFEEANLMLTMFGLTETEPALFGERVFETVDGKGSESLEETLAEDKIAAMHVCRTLDITKYARKLNEKGYEDVYLCGTAEVTEEVLVCYEEGLIQHVNLTSFYYLGYRFVENMHKKLMGGEVAKIDYIKYDRLCPETEEELLPKYKELLARAENVEYLKYTIDR